MKPTICANVFYDFDAYSRELTRLHERFKAEQNQNSQVKIKSKVRDENGNLRVVYHGTGADFTVFDKSKDGQNYSDRGGDLGFYVSPCIVFPGRRNAKTAKKKVLWQSKKRKPWNHCGSKVFE